MLVNLSHYVDHHQVAKRGGGGGKGGFRLKPQMKVSFV